MGELGQGVHSLVVQPVLQREDLSVKPLLQGQVVGEGARKGHGPVGVGVFEPGDQQIALQIDLPLEYRLLPRGGRAHMDDPVPLRPELALPDMGAAAKAQDLPVVKAYHGSLLSIP